MRLADIRRQRFAGMHGHLPAGWAGNRRLALPATIAPFGKHEFAVIAVRHSVPLGIGPKVAGAGLIDVGLALLQGNAVPHHTLVIVRVLFAAVANLPGLFGVVAGDGRHRPNVTISGNLAAVIEVVQNAELASQLMLVGRNGFPIHAQRGIAIAGFQVAKNLVIGTILFDDIDDVLDRILARLERKSVAVAAEQIAGEHFIR